MCSFMLICQCCFAIIKVLLKKVTYLLTYLYIYTVDAIPAIHIVIKSCSQ